MSDLEYLILNLLDPAVGIKVLCVSHDSCGDDLVNIVIDDADFFELLHFARNVALTDRGHWAGESH